MGCAVGMGRGEEGRMADSGHDNSAATVDDVGENDIAIVGMALRVPGANDPTEFWQNLRDGRESIVDYSEEQLLEGGEHPDTLRKPSYVSRGGALSDMKLFDRDFFGFSPKEAAILDPQHRHFMELCWEALEDAGHTPGRFDGQIGLFGGCGMGSYFYFNVCSHRDLIDDVGLFLLRHTGNDKDFLATRVSYVLDLKGPSVNVQTACSTSLVATHYACQSLLTGECDLALAGGITIQFPTEAGYVYKDGEVLSPDGHCHAFDHRAQGTVLTSGGGVVSLRRLEDATRDGDPIYAVIKGSAVNNDGGQKVGYLAPSVDGQAAAMTEVYSLADIDPASIGMIECHGTGTYMGDPIEVAALTQAFRNQGSEDAEANQFCRIGSVKTNIGHLDTAAGVVGLMKAALALHNEEMPPTINYEQPNPEIGFERTPFVVNDALTEWRSGEGVRRAAVNSLGVGGTNAHVVVEEYHPFEPGPGAVAPSADPDRVLFQFAAKSTKALDGACRKLAGFLENEPDTPLADVAYSLQQTREAFETRRVVVAKDRSEAIELLEGLDPRRVFTHGVPDARPSLAFMFSGGGSQYPGMARDLYETEPVFREHVDRGLSMYQEKTAVDLRSLVFCEAGAESEVEAPLTETIRQLPAIFIVEYAMVQLWKSWGIEPDIMIGHSMGENVAACISGVITYEECLDWMIIRGRLVDTTEPGGMIGVSLPEYDLIPFLDGRCDLASVNAPSLTVASGGVEEVDALEKRLDEAEIDYQRVAINVAGHSRLFDPILEEFRTFIRGLDLKKPSIPFISNRTGQPITDDQALDPEYWVEHLRREVRFSDGLASILETPGRVLLEVGPGQTLSSFARQQPSSTPINIVSSIRHRADQSGDADFFLAAVGRLWASGVEIELDALYEGQNRRRVRLPTYAWNHQSYFYDRIEPMVEAIDSGRPERIEDLADWGSVPTWHPAAADPRRLEAPTSWLLFMDRAGVGKRLRQRLEDAGHTVTCVYEGDAFRKRSEFEYSLAPELGFEGYNALVKDLAASGHAPTRIAHLWLATDGEHFRPGSSFFHENLQNGFWSLFFLAKALGDENLPGDVHVSVVSTGMHALEGDDGPLHPEKATVFGPALVMPRELPGVTCKTIDVSLPTKGAAAWLGKLGLGGGNATRPESLDDLSVSLEAELLAPPENEVIALRGADRFVRRFESRPLAARADDAAPTLREQGVYLVTGGLGGLGLTLADRIAREAPGARLALVGRTPLPPREDWDAVLAGDKGSAAEARTLRRVRTIEESGAEVEIVTGDVTRLDDMRSGLEQVRERFGKLDGIFHVAGVVDDELIQLKNDADIERVFGPKVHGTEVLDSLLDESGAELLVLYSSTSALTAPTGQVDYVAANAFLDAFAHSRKDHPIRTVAVNWGIWNEVGLAARNLSGEADASEETVSTAVQHPFFETRERDSHGRTGFLKSYSPQRDWILDEHRTKNGEALFPGAGYPELARAALAEYGETGPFEIHDLYFLRPLYVPDGEIRDVRVQLEPTDSGYKFGVRTRHRIDGRPAWVLACEARLELGAESTPESVDVAAIDTRCQRSRSSVNPLGHRTGQDNHVRFGPRWRVLRQVLYGEREALAHLELAEAYAAEVEDYALHPALLDLATGYAMELIEDYDPDESLWVPVSYGRIQIHGPLAGKVHSWVRIRDDIEDSRNFASFDVTIVDEGGHVLFEATDFTIKRVEEAVDFSEPVDTKTSDIEFESASHLQDEDDLSPAELQLRRNYEAGILPEEGTEALLRALSADLGPQVAISSIALDTLRKQASEVVLDSSGGGTRFERPDLDSEYVEPRDEIEKTLVTLWEELLGVEGLGVQDSFFDLGGHSLIAVRFFTKIKKTYRVDFPISVLFEAPTIEGCAALIRESIGDDGGAAADGGEKAAAVPKTRFKHLVAMDAGADAGKPPFFLVAGMFGNVLNLRHLASLVGTDRPFYGLQARGLYGGEEPHASFDEMATAYIEEIRHVQPHGPYTIGGFSGGGITAFEMAHQLTEAGEEVSMLLMLDSLLPVEPPITTLDRVRVQLLRVKQRGAGYLWEWARNRAKWQWEQIQARFDEEEPDQPDDEFHNVAIERAFRAALPIYRMRHYAGRVHLFRPKQDHAYVLGEGRILNSDKRWVFPDNGWGDWVDEVEVSEMPGNHDSMVLEPNVRVMAARLREVLESIEDD